MADGGRCGRRLGVGRLHDRRLREVLDRVLPRPRDQRAGRVQRGRRAAGEDHHLAEALGVHVVVAGLQTDLQIRERREPVAVDVHRVVAVRHVAERVLPRGVRLRHGDRRVAGVDLAVRAHVEQLHPHALLRGVAGVHAVVGVQVVHDGADDGVRARQQRPLLQHVRLRVEGGDGHPRRAAGLRGDGLAAAAKHRVEKPGEKAVRGQTHPCAPLRDRWCVFGGGGGRADSGPSTIHVAGRRGARRPRARDFP